MPRKNFLGPPPFGHSSAPPWPPLNLHDAACQTVIITLLNLVTFKLHIHAKNNPPPKKKSASICPKTKNKNNLQISSGFIIYLEKHGTIPWRIRVGCLGVRPPPWVLFLHNPLTIYKIKMHWFTRIKIAFKVVLPEQNPRSTNFFLFFFRE